VHVQRLVEKDALPGLLQMLGSVAGKTSAWQGASKDAVLVSCFALSGLWNKNLCATGHKDDADVTEVALV